jgi:hypothetical protein
MELENLTLYQDIDILTLSETWLNSSNTNASIALPRYRLFRFDRKGKYGGGTCVYVHNRLQGRALNDLTDISNTGFQQQWIQIQREKLKSLLNPLIAQWPVWTMI